MNTTLTQTPSVVTVTPTLAKDWLSKNTRNRRLSEAMVSRYAQAITAGEWMLNGEPIKFSKSGALIDGQHRLNACIRAGVPFSTYVIRGLNEDVFATLDMGKNRRTPDLISIEGGKHVNTVAAAISWATNYRAAENTGNFISDSIRSPKALMDIYNSDREGYLEAAELAVNYNTKLLPGSIMAGFAYIIMETGNGEYIDLMHEIFGHVCSGDRSTKPQVIFLREWLINDRMQRVKSNREYLSMAVVKCWNAIQRNKEFTSVRYSRKEGFPTIIL